MAMTTCRECGNQVSDQAANCPACGIGRPTLTVEQVAKAQAKDDGSTALMVVGFVALVTAAGLWHFLSASSRQDSAPVVPAKAKERPDPYLGYSAQDPKSDDMRMYARIVSSHGLWCPQAFGVRFVDRPETNSRKYATILCKEGRLAQQHLLTMDHRFNVLFVSEIPNPP